MTLLLAFLRWMFPPPPLWMRQRDCVSKVCRQLVPLLYDRETNAAKDPNPFVRAHIHWLLRIAEATLHSLVWLRAVQLLGHDTKGVGKITRPKFTQDAPGADQLRMRLRSLLRRLDALDALIWRCVRKLAARHDPIRLAGALHATSPACAAADTPTPPSATTQGARWLSASSRTDGGGRPRAPP